MNIVIEGDAKVCFDAIADNSPAPWAISTLITNIIEPSRSFMSCCFCWIRRGANDTAHTLAKFASHSRFPIHCNYDSLSPIVWDVCMRDVLALFLFNEMFGFNQKKKTKYWIKYWLIITHPSLKRNCSLFESSLKLFKINAFKKIQTSKMTQNDNFFFFSFFFLIFYNTQNDNPFFFF